MNRSKMRIAAVEIGLMWSLIGARPILAKLELVRVTITGAALPAPVEITDQLALRGFNIWSGPGNFKIEGGLRIPIVRDGSILWSQGIVSEPPKELPKYELTFYGGLPEERIMYVFRYVYDSIARKGYVYLPGRGEKWYEVNVRSILRGVEGNWFHASEDFANAVEAAVRKAKAASEK